VSEERIEIDSIVGNWFEESLQLIKTYPILTKADNLLAAVILCARKHTISILLLLANNHRLSAQALLRVLCELYVTLVWCLGLPEKLSKDGIYKRFQRWDYSRVIRHKKILLNLAKAYPNSSDINASLDKAENSIEDCKNRGVKALPDVAGIFNQVAQANKEKEKDWKEHIYPKIYQDFSSAIHSDMRILRQLVQYDKIASYREDIDYSIDKLKSYCVSMAHDINIVIRDQYEDTGGISDKMQKEYKSIIGKLTKSR